MMWFHLYLLIGGIWAAVCAMILAMAWGEEKLTRPVARALILAPVWPVVVVRMAFPIARAIWRATGWR